MSLFGAAFLSWWHPNIVLRSAYVKNSKCKMCRSQATISLCLWWWLFLCSHRSHHFECVFVCVCDDFSTMWNFIRSYIFFLYFSACVRFTFSYTQKSKTQIKMLSPENRAIMYSMWLPFHTVYILTQHISVYILLSFAYMYCVYIKMCVYDDGLMVCVLRLD